MYFVLFLHVVIQEFTGSLSVHMLGGAPLPNSRPERGPEPRGVNKVDDEGFFVAKARQDIGEKLAFPQQLSEKLHVETWAGGCQPQPEDFPGTGNRGKVCCGWVPSSDSVCHSCATQ